jgi:HPt (histidine-containing phosphotransfer) domain-containing protein
MSRPLDAERRRVPDDWGIPNPYHGFTRNNEYHDYIVQMHVCKTTVQFARVKDAKLAAQIYDIALWKLNPFTPACAKPNFPEEFKSITQADVDTHCPLANKFYDRALKQIESAGVTLESLVQAKNQRLAVLTVDISAGAVAEYAALMRTVHEMHTNAATIGFKLTARRCKVGLSKFPEITRRLDDAANRLTDMEAEARELLSLLTDHKDLFQKMRSL